ncbi:MAG TPA: hypothetical protein VMY35_03775, partial [Phycisphaerae bacterium]|nr:hypothetical protein [Phycisphaerae bacterium]
MASPFTQLELQEKQRPSPFAAMEAADASPFAAMDQGPQRAPPAPIVITNTSQGPPTSIAGQWPAQPDLSALGPMGADLTRRMLEADREEAERQAQWAKLRSIFPELYSRIVTRRAGREQGGARPPSMGTPPETPFVAELAGVVNSILGRNPHLTPPYETAPLSPEQLASAGPMGAVETVRRDGVAIPFDPREMLDLGVLYGAAQRLKAAGDRPYGGREFDTEVVENYLMDYYERAIRGKTLAGDIAGGLAELPGWMGEFLITGGAASLGRKAATKAAGRVASKGLRKAIIGGVGAAIARTAVMPHRVGAEYVRNRLPEGMELTDDGQLVSIEAGDAPATAFMRAFGNVLIETASEEAGATISRGVKGAAGGVLRRFPKAHNAVGRVAERLKRIAGANRWGQWANKGFSAVGYSDLIGEIGEEQLARTLHAALGTDSNLRGLDAFDRWMTAIPTGKQLATEAIVLSVPGAARAGLNAISRQAPAPAEAPAAPLAPPVTPTEAIGPAEAPTPAPAPEVAPEAEKAAERVEPEKLTPEPEKRPEKRAESAQAAEPEPEAAPELAVPPKRLRVAQKAADKFGKPYYVWRGPSGRWAHRATEPPGPFRTVEPQTTKEQQADLQARAAEDKGAKDQAKQLEAEIIAYHNKQIGSYDDP